MSKKTKKTIQVELKFDGDGRVLEKRPGYFVGGVPAPKVGDELTFTVHREVPDEDGIMNPIPGEATVEAGFQINIYGTTKSYRELGKYFLALAELDTTQDVGFHKHHDGLKSSDGRTQLHLIFRKSNDKTRNSNRKPLRRSSSGTD